LEPRRKKKIHKKELKRILDIARRKKVELKEQHQKILLALKEAPEEVNKPKEEKKEEKKEENKEEKDGKGEAKKEAKETPPEKKICPHIARIRFWKVDATFTN